MKKLAMLFSDRDFEKVDFEIEDAIKCDDGRQKELHRRIPEIYVSRSPDVAAAIPTVPSFLLNRHDRLQKQEKSGGNQSVAAATSPYHLVWMVPLCAFVINYVANDELSTFGLFIAPILPWFISAISGCILRDRSLDRLRTTAAIMQLAAAVFIGTIVLKTWTIEFTEAVVFSMAGVLFVGELLVILRKSKPSKP